MYEGHKFMSRQRVAGSESEGTASAWRQSTIQQNKSHVARILQKQPSTVELVPGYGVR